MKTTYVQCSSCNGFTDKFSLVCDKCDITREDVTIISPFAIHIFRSGYYEHIDLKPIYIKNKAELRHQTEYRGLTSHYVH